MAVSYIPTADDIPLLAYDVDDSAEIIATISTLSDNTKIDIISDHFVSGEELPLSNIRQAKEFICSGSVSRGTTYISNWRPTDMAD